MRPFRICSTDGAISTAIYVANAPDPDGESSSRSRDFDFLIPTIIPLLNFATERLHHCDLPQLAVR
jgi:hypothetical protein